MLIFFFLVHSVIFFVLVPVPCWGRVVFICVHAVGVCCMSRGTTSGSELLERARVRDDGYAHGTTGTDRDVQVVSCGERHVVLRHLPLCDSHARYRAGDECKFDINGEAPARIRAAPAIPRPTARPNIIIPIDNTSKTSAKNTKTNEL